MELHLAQALCCTQEVLVLVLVIIAVTIIVLDLMLPQLPIILIPVHLDSLQPHVRLFVSTRRPVLGTESGIICVQPAPELPDTDPGL